MIGRALSTKTQQVNRGKNGGEARARDHQKGIILKDAHDQVRNRERRCREQSQQVALIACLGRVGRGHNDLVSRLYRINSSPLHNIRLNIYE